MQKLFSFYPAYFILFVIFIAITHNSNGQNLLFNNLKTGAFLSKFKYDKAHKSADKTINIAKDKGDTLSGDYGCALLMKAVIYVSESDENLALPYAIKAYNILQNSDVLNRNMYLGMASLTLASVYNSLGEYNKVEPLLLSSKSFLDEQLKLPVWMLTMISKSINIPINKIPKDLKKDFFKYCQTFTINLGLSSIYMEQGREKEGEELMLENIRLANKIKAAYPYHYLASNVVLSYHYIIYAKMYKSDSISKIVNPIIDDLLKRKNISLAMKEQIIALYDSHALYYEKTNENERALTLLTKTNKAYKKHPFKDKTPYIRSLLKTSSCYERLYLYKKADSCYSEAVKVAELYKGKNNTIYADVIQNYAMFLISFIGTKDTAKVLYKKGIKIKRGKNSAFSVLDVTDLIHYSTICIKLGDFNEADSILKEISFFMDKYKSNYQALYFNIIGLQAVLSFKQGDYKSSENYLAMLLAYQQSFFNYLSTQLNKENNQSEWDKVLFSLNMYYSLIQKKGTSISNLSSSICQQMMINKAHLFATETTILNKTKNHTDPIIKDKYSKWKAQVNKVNSFQNKNIEYLSSKKINISEEIDISNDLYRELAYSVPTLDSLFNSVNETWQNVQQKLKKEDAIIQINKYWYEDSLTQKIKYAYVAYVLTNKTKEMPIVIPINNEGILDSIYQFNVSSSVQNSNIIVDSDIIYKLFWYAIDTFLVNNQIKNVYFCPEGIYYNINPYNMVVNDNTYVLDRKYSIKFVNKVSSSIFNKKEIPTEKTAYLVGNPKCYNKLKEEIAHTEGKVKKGGFDSLSHSEIEVDSLYKLLRSLYYEVKIDKNTNATEKAVKEINAPSILHLSTHAFIDSMLKSQNIYYLNRYVIAFSNAENSYNKLHKKEILPDNEEDGLLRGNEIEQIALNNTHLVVLSACQSGLGEIQAGEGVLGLQRSFFLAGAQSLLVSLWKIDDDGTDYFMTTFYKKWLIDGLPKHLALKETQLKLKNEDYSPNIWAAFILIER